MPLPPRSAFTRPAASDGDAARRALAAIADHPQAVHSGARQAFTVTEVLVDSDGTSHVRVARTYAGFRSSAATSSCTSPRPAPGRASARASPATSRLAATPAVTKAAAAAAALAPSAVTRSITGEKVSSSRLVVDAVDGTPRLAYEVITGGTQKDGTPSRLASYVDARTGKVLRTEQQIETVDGSGQSLYGGTVPLQLTLSGSTYQLKDPTRGNTYTTDMNNKRGLAACQIFGSGCATGTLFTSPDNSFGNGTTSSRESAAVDAQYGTNETWDYYNNVHGRNGIFGTGKGSFNRVHYGNGYVNAFWDGTKMTYGDGDGASYGPLTSLDVAGHEMSHGVTENSAEPDLLR